MRRHKASIVAVALLLATALVACDDDEDGASTRGSGNVITETREVSGFDEIAVFGSGKVIVDVTGSESLTIEAEDNIMPFLETEVRNGRLELEVDGNISPTQDIEYTVTAAELQGVSIAGSGDVTATGVDTDEFTVDIAGSGDVAPAGTAGELSVDIAGSGRFQGEDLVVTTATIDVAGSGDAVVNATEMLDIDVAGSGNVEYIGRPTVNQSVSGSGEVRQR